MSIIINAIEKRMNNRLTMSVVIILCAGWLFFIFANPLATINDFWWHIATGRYIFENGQLPEIDPFSQVTRDTVNPREKGILQGYWLAQLIYFGFYKLLGWWGLIVLKSGIFTSIVLILLKLLRNKRVAFPLAIFAILPLALFGSNYVPLRPHGFTFLGVALLLYFLEKIPGEKDKKNFNLTKSISLPMIMIAWGNLHPGYIIGIAVLLIYGVAESYRFIKSWKNTRMTRSKEFFQTMGVLSFSILVSFINPNHFSLLIDYLLMLMDLSSQNRSDHFMQNITEYFTPWRYAEIYGTYFDFYGLVLTALIFGGVLFIFRKHLKLEHFLLFVAFSLAGLYIYRFSIVFIIIAISIGGQYLAYLQGSYAKRMNYVASGAVLIAVMFSIPTGYQRSVLRLGVFDTVLPVRAVDHIKKNNLPGPILHPYEWGGYFIWRLYPDYRVFIDSRTLNDEAHSDYKKIGLNDEKSTWELFDKYNFNTVAYYYFIPGIDNIAGSFLIYLLRNPDWVITYLDRKSVIFSKKSLAIGVNIIDRTIFGKHVMSVLHSKMRANPGNPNSYFMAGLFSYALHDNITALKYLNHAKKITPGLNGLNYWIRRVMTE